MAFRRHLNSHVVANLNESCLFSRAHPAEQPGTRILPVPAHGDGGDTQSRSHFAIRVTAEITHFDHSRRPRLQPLQACSAASGSPCCMRFSSRVSCDGVARRRLLLLALNHLATVYSHAKEKGI